jgi:hypothetical protein
MEDPPEEDQHRRDYIWYRREVYHRAWQTALESIELPSSVGMAVRCAKRMDYVVFPNIPIISVDFEEAQVSSSYTI